MATYDVADYLAELKLITGRSNTDFDTLIYKWLNNLSEKIRTDPENLWFFDKTVQFTIAALTAAIYNIPADMESEFGLFIVDSVTNGYTEITPISDHEAKKRYGPGDKGTPERYTIKGRILNIWPLTPDVAYLMELNYRARLAEVSGTTDTSDFMKNHHSVVMDGLQAQAWEYLQQYEKSTMFWSKWKDGWNEMRASNVAKILAGEIMIKPRADAMADSDSERDFVQRFWRS